MLEDIFVEGGDRVFKTLFGVSKTLFLFRGEGGVGVGVIVAVGAVMNNAGAPNLCALM